MQTLTPYSFLIQLPYFKYSSESKLSTKHFEVTRKTPVSKSLKDDRILDKVYLFTVSKYAAVISTMYNEDMKAWENDALVHAKSVADDLQSPILNTTTRYF